MCTGDERGPDRDGEMGIGGREDRPTGVLLHGLGHRGDPGGAAHHENGRDVVPGRPGRRDHPIHHCERVGETGANHGLELTSGQAHARAERGQLDGDLGLGVLRQMLLGALALVPQPTEGGAHVGLFPIERGDLPVGRRVDVGEDGLVEVDPAEPLDALGIADNLPRLPVPHHGSVEGAATEVVDGDQ